MPLIGMFGQESTHLVFFIAIKDVGLKRFYITHPILLQKKEVLFRHQCYNLRSRIKLIFKLRQ